jgi:stage V sporulation protein B
MKDKSNYIIKDVLSLSIPISSNRFITTFTYFLEPIILTSILTKLGYSSSFIVYEYGLLESYAIPIIFLPGFFAAALSTFLLPNLSSQISKRHYKKGKNLFLLVSFLSLIIGLFSASICYLFPEFLLNLLYKNIEAKEYVKILALPFIVYYIEAPISTAMYALSLEKQSLIICIISSIIRILSLFILIPKYNVLATAYSTLIEIIIVVGLDLFFIFKFFKNNIRTSII